MYLYRLRIRPERAPEVWRVFEFSARHTLHDVHHAIQDAFELDDDHLHAFYLSGKRWDRESEVAAEDAGGVRLFRLRLEPGRRFRYVFDFGDELWHELEVVAVSESETAPEEPLLIESVGEAPPQYDDEEARDDESDDDEIDDDESEDDEIDDDESEDDESDDDEIDDEADLDVPQAELDRPELMPLAQKLVGLLASDPDPTTEAGREVLRSAYPIASDLAARLDADEERFWELDEANQDLVEVLLDLPFALGQAGMPSEGSDLALALAFIDPLSFLPDRALLLAVAGQREAALSQLTENLRSMGDDILVEVKAGETYAILGEVAEAEARFRSALERASDPDDRASALEQLLELLRAQNREAEASALEAAERRRRPRSVAARADYEQPVLAPAPNRWLSPKVGRNDPCPCGSAKKYKKCCDASA